MRARKYKLHVLQNTEEARPRTGNQKTSLPACSTTTDACTMPLAVELGLARHAATVIGVVNLLTSADHPVTKNTGGILPLSH
ncbi:hypothetical protein G5I_14469 [Acromyrmex echinatior]|uniref:Uncharacterized protein n=1 Tax=Acromyrmex echinatior TaxID=103372 RepID=F4X7T5_ACREC|nr:hypothetical protein G5I_14469 [Acromyrmex echinatior]